MMRLISIAAALALPAALSAAPASPRATATSPAERPWRIAGKLAHKPISECSGIVASRRHPGVFWVHNDSGNAPILYAVKTDGALVGEFAVAAANEDWEDIAIDDDGQLYLGDIGNNGARRRQLVVYRLDEPDPATSKQAVRLKVTRTWTLTFPAAPFDCEALFVHGGHGYVVSKLYLGAHAGLYRFPLDESKDPVMLEKIATVPVRTPVTAADISPDARRLLVLSVAGVNVFQINGDLAAADKAKALFIPYIHATMEAACFTPAGQVLVATEPRDMLIFDVRADRGKTTNQNE